MTRTILWHVRSPPDICEDGERRTISLTIPFVSRQFVTYIVTKWMYLFYISFQSKLSHVTMGSQSLREDRRSRPGKRICVGEYGVSCLERRHLGLYHFRLLSGRMVPVCTTLSCFLMNDSYFVLSYKGVLHYSDCSRHTREMENQSFTKSKVWVRTHRFTPSFLMCILTVGL